MMSKVVDGNFSYIDKVFEIILDFCIIKEGRFIISDRKIKLEIIIIKVFFIFFWSGFFYNIIRMDI